MKETQAIPQHHRQIHPSFSLSQVTTSVTAQGSLLTILLAAVPVCLSTTKWQVVASSDPRIETDPGETQRRDVKILAVHSGLPHQALLDAPVPSLGVVAANSLCWTYKRPRGPTA